MIETWFISDTHFGHKNILEYEKSYRPFDEIEEMNEVLIDRWNSVVCNHDIIYHLGDFCFGRNSLEIAKRLNGKKKLVLGNHDTYPVGDYLQFFTQIYGVIFWKNCILSHVPVHPSMLSKRAVVNVHGHTHSNSIMHQVDYKSSDPLSIMTAVIKLNDPRYFNVSCEKNNLTPINGDIILKLVQELSTV